MVLLTVLKNLEKALSLQISAVHIHHGENENFEARNQAQFFCQGACEKLQVPLQIAKAPMDLALKSEEDFRDFRRQIFFKASLSFDSVVTAHHQEDLLETRMLRLLRGTGPQGLLAIGFKSEIFLRPFLEISRKDILSYATESFDQQLSWIEDPSNGDLKYLRNWLRREWFPALEARQPGALGALARSLELILEQTSMERDLPLELWRDGVLDSVVEIQRSVFLSLSKEKQKQALAQSLLRLGRRDFSHSQIVEALKHLDKVEKEHKFHLAHCDWKVNAELIRLETV